MSNKSLTIPDDGSVDAGLLMLSLVTPNGRTYTLDEIAFVCGCSLQCIQQIEQRALKKMRVALQQRKLKAKDFI